MLFNTALSNIIHYSPKQALKEDYSQILCHLTNIIDHKQAVMDHMPAIDAYIALLVVSPDEALP